MEHSIKAWVKANGCPEKPTVTDMPKKIDDGTTVQRKTYGPGKDGAEVILFIINGGGHTWPGRELGQSLLGKSTKNISANDLMWEFFTTDESSNLLNNYFTSDDTSDNHSIRFYGCCK